MAKSTNKLQREYAKPDKLSPPVKQEAESSRALQSEIQSLRDLVVLLTAALMRNMALDSGGKRHAVSSADAQLLGRALDSLSRPFPGHELLTSRERLVLAQIVRGASSKEAAQALAISARTVKSHRANILLKLGAKNTAELVRTTVKPAPSPVSRSADANGPRAEFLNCLHQLSDLLNECRTYHR